MQASTNVPPTTSQPLASAPPPPAVGASSAAHGRGKRRGYAEQQYEFGQGANAALTPSSGGGAYPSGQPYQAAQPGPGYPPEAPQPPYGQPMAAPVGYPGAPMPAVGGYDPTGGVGGMAQQFGQMSMGGTPMQQPPQMMPQPQGMQKTQGLNQLITVDLMQQPFNAAELDLPPPEIILPPNVRSFSDARSWGIYLEADSV
jgi:protein transport protein SEC24